MKTHKIVWTFPYYAFIIMMLITTSSCVSTRIEANPYQDGPVNIKCQKKNSWSYAWGLVQKTISANPEIEGTECPCRNKAMTWVETKTSFVDVLLNLVTVGIVNHRTVTYGCTRDQDGEGRLDD